MKGWRGGELFFIFPSPAVAISLRNFFYYRFFFPKLFNWSVLLLFIFVSCVNIFMNATQIVDTGSRDDCKEEKD